MNTLKIQTKILEAWSKDSTRPKCRYQPGPDTAKPQRIAVTFDGFALYILNRAECLIDLDKLGAPMTVLWQFMNNCSLEGRALLEHTGMERFTDNGKRVAIYTGACGEVHLDPKLLTYFDKGAQLYGHSDRDAVLVVEGDEVVGCVLPVRRNTETK